MAGHTSYSLRGPWDCCSRHEVGVLDFAGSAPCMVTSGGGKEAVRMGFDIMAADAEEKDAPEERATL